MAEERWRRLAEKWEKGKLTIKVTFKGEVLFYEKGLADDVIEQFRAFLEDHPEILPLTCSGKIHLHPKTSVSVICPQCGGTLALDQKTGLLYCPDCPWKEAPKEASS